MSVVDVDDLQRPGLLLMTKPDVELVPDQRLTIDTMLQKYCGEFGPWQLKNFLLCNLSCTLEAFHTMVMIFADRQPEWRCVEESGCDATAKSVCGLKPGSWEWVGGHGSSTVAEWDLVCENKYKVGLAQAMFFVGCTFGAGIFGYLSDSKFGRKRSLVLVCILNTIFGCLTALSPSYSMYVALRLLTGVSTAGNEMLAFVLSTEPIGPTKRGTAGLSTFYFFSGGIALLSGIAYIFQSWRKLYIVSSIPSLFYLIIILPFIPESPRWYLIHGKLDKAMKLLTSIAKTNKKHIPEKVIISLDKEVKDHHQDQNPKHKAKKDNEKLDNNGTSTSTSLIDVIRSPITRNRLLIGLAINFLNAIVYYGLSLNVVNLETNLYVNVLLNAVIEMPAFLVTATLSERIGRKGIGISTLWFSGVFCFIGSLMKSNGKWKVMKMICGLLGISGMAGNYNLIFLYFAELFPTVVRNAAIGCGSQGTQMGAILAPFVVVLSGRLPFMVFAGCGFVGGMLVFLLPETLNRPLFDTLDGLEDGEVDSIL